MTDSLADEILFCLRKAAPKRITAKVLSEKFSASVESVQESVETLLEWGYIIRTGSGWYEFKRAPDALLAEEILFGLKTKKLGRRVSAYRKVKSTITIASSLADSGAEEGTLVIAEEQSAGRGRLGRNWHSPASLGAYLTIIVRPKIKAADAPALSLVTALALAEAIESECDLTALVKWPNDILIHGKKVAGLLSGMTADGSRTNYALISAGININQLKDDFPKELRGKATSLRIATRRKVDRAALVRAFLLVFEKRYHTFLRSGFSRLRKPVSERLALVGKQVLISGAATVNRSAKSSGGNLSGAVVDIDAQGRLLIDTPEGRLELIAGEMSLEANY